MGTYKSGIVYLKDILEVIDYVNFVNAINIDNLMLLGNSKDGTDKIIYLTDKQKEMFKFMGLSNISFIQYLLEEEKINEHE